MDIDVERRQLIETWGGVVARNWKKNPCSNMRRLLNMTNDAFNMPFRKCHDRLGWKAKDDLKQGGICAGTIYRTAAFMEVPLCERTGKKTGPQTVHIEHTVPVKVLESTWRQFRKDSSINSDDQRIAYAWLLTHSVTTAFRKGQEARLGSLQDTTAAFDRNSKDFGFPFRRYNGLAKPQDVVWNVFTKKPIDSNTWTFEKHLTSVLELMHEAWQSQPFHSEIASIRTSAEPLACVLRPRHFAR